MSTKLDKIITHIIKTIALLSDKQKINNDLINGMAEKILNFALLFRETFQKCEDCRQEPATFTCNQRSLCDRCCAIEVISDAENVTYVEFNNAENIRLINDIINESQQTVH